MTKKLGIATMSVTGTSTLSNWKAATKQEILNNNGTVPIRIDKFMAGVTAVHSYGSFCYVGVMVHLSDTNGNTVLDTVDGTGADLTSDLNTLMEKWKDYIWMTDFRLVGSGSDENILTSIELDAGTKRLLEPGQKLYVSLLWMCTADNSAANVSSLLDYALWFQQGAAT
jgi:hypothetical protein